MRPSVMMAPVCNPPRVVFQNMALSSSKRKTRLWRLEGFVDGEVAVKELRAGLCFLAEDLQ